MTHVGPIISHVGQRSINRCKAFTVNRFSLWQNHFHRDTVEVNDVTFPCVREHRDTVEANDVTLPCMHEHRNTVEVNDVTSPCFHEHRYTVEVNDVTFLTMPEHSPCTEKFLGGKMPPHVKWENINYRDQRCMAEETQYYWELKSSQSFPKEQISRQASI